MHLASVWASVGLVCELREKVISQSLLHKVHAIRAAL